ncbi:MAG: ABC transporter permease subunit [Robiginitomaculum sp.]|nr:ABC transporter permease subunit [Robiginitomaculum sp.]
MTTLWITFLASSIGLLIGFVVGFMTWKSKTMSKTVLAMGMVVASLPVLAILFWVHYPLQSAFGVVIAPIYSATIIFAVVNAFLVADTVTNAAKQLPKEYIECGNIYGFSKYESIRKIEFPLIMRSSIPALLKIQVAVLHMTLFASLISVEELFRVAQRINSIEYAPIPIYTLLAIFYLGLSLPIIFLAQALRKKFSLPEEREAG